MLFKHNFQPENLQEFCSFELNRLQNVNASKFRSRIWNIILLKKLLNLVSRTSHYPLSIYVAEGFSDQNLLQALWINKQSFIQAYPDVCIQGNQP